MENYKFTLTEIQFKTMMETVASRSEICSTIAEGMRKVNELGYAQAFDMDSLALGELYNLLDNSYTRDQSTYHFSLSLDEKTNKLFVDTLRESANTAEASAWSLQKDGNMSGAISQIVLAHRIMDVHITINAGLETKGS